MKVHKRSARKKASGAGAWGAGSSSPPGCTPGAASSDTKKEATVFTTVSVSSAAASSSLPIPCVGLHWDSSSNEDVPYHPGPMQGQCQTSPSVSSSPAPPSPHHCRSPTTPPSASSYLLCLTQNDSVADLRAVDSPLHPQSGRSPVPLTESLNR